MRLASLWSPDAASRLDPTHALADHGRPPTGSNPLVPEPTPAAGLRPPVTGSAHSADAPQSDDAGPARHSLCRFSETSTTLCLAPVWPDEGATGASACPLWKGRRRTLPFEQTARTSSRFSGVPLHNESFAGRPALTLPLSEPA